MPIVTLEPASAGTFGQWDSGDGGGNEGNVQLPDDDLTTAVLTGFAADSPPQKSTWALDQLPVGVGVINSVSIRVRHQVHTGGGSSNLMKSALYDPTTTNWTLGSFLNGGAWTTTVDVMANPNGGVWTIEEVNRIEAGVEYISGATNGLRYSTVTLDVDYELAAGGFIFFLT